MPSTISAPQKHLRPTNPCTMKPESVSRNQSVVITQQPESFTWNQSAGIMHLGTPASARGSCASHRAEGRRREKEEEHRYWTTYAQPTAALTALLQIYQTTLNAAAFTHLL